LSTKLVSLRSCTLRKPGGKRRGMDFYMNLLRLDPFAGGGRPPKKTVRRIRFGGVVEIFGSCLQKSAAI